MKLKAMQWLYVLSHESLKFIFKLKTIHKY